MSKKILIVDDEADYLVALKDFLKYFDYSIEVALFPDYALDVIKGHQPELVLFDYKMPDMDGDIFLKKAKELSTATKYILITAYRDDVIIEKIKKIGVVDIILKPIDLQNLLEKIQNVLK